MDEARQKAVEAYLKEIGEVNKRHLKRLVPFIETARNGAMNPRFTVEDMIPEPKKESEQTPSPEQEIGGNQETQPQPEVPAEVTS